MEIMQVLDEALKYAKTGPLISKKQEKKCL
jgi:hypothetical protein